MSNGRLEFFQKIIRLGSGILPLLIHMCDRLSLNFTLFHNFGRIVNNQPTPSNWDLEPVVMKRSRSHRLTILSFFCLFCISQQLLDINLFILTCPKLLERGWPLSGGWLTQSFDQMKSYRECGAKTNNQLPGEVRTQQRMRGLGGESALRITSDFVLCTAAM